MSPFLEVLLKCTPSPVAGTAAYFALKLLTETVQLVQPVRDWLAVPPHRQILRVVFDTVFVAVIASYGHSFREDILRFQRFLLCLDFLVG